MSEVPKQITGFSKQTNVHHQSIRGLRPFVEITTPHKFIQGPSKSKHSNPLYVELYLRIYSLLPDSESAPGQPLKRSYAVADFEKQLKTSNTKAASENASKSSTFPLLLMLVYY